MHVSYDSHNFDVLTELRVGCELHRKTYLWCIIEVARLAGDAAGLMVAGAGHVRGGIVPGRPGESDGDETEESEKLHGDGNEA